MHAGSKQCTSLASGPSDKDSQPGCCTSQSSSRVYLVIHCPVEEPCDLLALLCMPSNIHAQLWERVVLGFTRVCCYYSCLVG